MSEANADSSLDRGTKYPTRPCDLISDQGEWIGRLETEYPVLSVKSPGTYARLSHREWSGEWRLSCITEPPVRQPPPQQSGQRITDKLSDGGRRKIEDSCRYVYLKRGGYSTFVTLTFDTAARTRMENQYPEGQFCPVSWSKTGKFRYQADPTIPIAGVTVLWGTTISHEVSRFLDAAKKMYTRGWVSPYRVSATKETKEGIKYNPIAFGPYRVETNKEADHIPIGPGYTYRFDYLWVAENPLNENGERNPHVHLLIRWFVPKKYFQPWARRLERLWGQGFAHLERLRDRSAAGYYLAKAAKYLTKGDNTNDQGLVRGNRYGIAQCSRAPAWKTLTHMEWGVLGECIAKARHKQRNRLNPIRRAKNAAIEKLKSLSDSSATAKKQVLNRLSTIRHELKKQKFWYGRCHVVATDIDSLDRFMIWAESKGWKQRKRPAKKWVVDWLASIKNMNIAKPIRCLPIG